MRSRLQIVDTTDNSGPELVTLEALKLELDIDDDSEDALLTARITRFSNLFAEECDRVFALSYAIETFTLDTATSFYPYAETASVLLLRIYPVVAIDSVTVDGSAITDFEFDADSGQLWRTGGAWWSGTVVVTYSGGYELPTDAPALLVEAIIQAISDRRSVVTDAGSANVRSITHGDTATTFFEAAASSTGLSSEVLAMLKSFKRPVLA